MSQLNQTLATLQGSGERITTARKQLLAVLIAAENPLSPTELQERLAKRGVDSNKTTIYRQLETLLKYNLIAEIQLADRSKRYELVPGSEHHHHLVCLRCATVDEIVFKDDVQHQERAIRSQKKFKVLRHQLEFYGICAKCQKKK